MENAEVIHLEDIRDLREKTEQSYIKNKLKPALVGGYERNSVVRLIQELKEREAKAGQTFTERINELTDSLKAVKQQAENLRSDLSEATGLKDQTQKSLEKLTREYQALKAQSCSDSKTLAELQRQCAEYESQVQKFRAVYEEVMTAKNYQAQYDDLLKEYKEIVSSRDQYAKKSAVLEQENVDLTLRNEKLSRDNEQLGRTLAELTVQARQGASDAEMTLGQYGETQKYHLGNLLKYAETFLSHIREMQEKENDFEKTLEEELEAFRF